jgi:ribonuclease BN (tRNA processing enzyme)
MPTNRHHYTCQKAANEGFMLFEVLVAVIVLTLGLLAILGAFSTSSKIIITSQHYQTALQLAEQKMFEIMNTPDEDLKDYGKGSFGDKYSEFTWEYDISEEKSEFYGDELGIEFEPDTFKKIILSVSYKERGKTLTPVTLVTYQTANLRYLE